VHPLIHRTIEQETGTEKATQGILPENTTAEGGKKMVRGRTTLYLSRLPPSVPLVVGRTAKAAAFLLLLHPSPPPPFRTACFRCRDGAGQVAAAEPASLLLYSSAPWPMVLAQIPFFALAAQYSILFSFSLWTHVLFFINQMFPVFVQVYQNNYFSQGEDQSWMSEFTKNHIRRFQVCGKNIQK